MKKQFLSALNFMRPGSIRPLMFLQLIIISLIGNAQVTTKTFRNGIPAALIETGVRDIPDIYIKAPAELENLLKQGEDPNPNQMSFRFGIAKKETVNVLKKAKITEQDGFIIYQSTVTAENALNMSLSFSKFLIPKNAVLKIYSKNEFTDGITETENGIGKKWRTRVYQGNRINISLKVPVEEKGRALLEIGKIIFGFRQIGGDIMGATSGTNPLPTPGQSANCHINVVCSLGNNWTNERRSVALIYDDNGFCFSGSLVMNTCNSNKPYILTAYHVFHGGGPNPSDCKYVFKYWRLGCDNSTELYNETYEIDGQGGPGEDNARIVASYENSDFALVLLSRAPSPTSGVYYSGWNRGGGVPSSITALHHPLGDVMKISQATQSGSITSTTWGVGSDNHWQAIFDMDKGLIQMGSSGGPIYDENRRIVGQIHGIYSTPSPCINGPQNPNSTHCTCVNPSAEQTAAKRSLSGKFSVSWEGGGIPTKRLKDWLDPLGLGNTFTNTTSIDALQPDPFTAQIGGDASICSVNGTASYSIDLPPGATVSWVTSNSSISVSPTTGSPVTVTYANTLNNSATLTANVVLNGPCNQGTYPRTKTIALGGPNCHTRTAYWYVNGYQTPLGKCAALTQTRPINFNQNLFGNWEYYANAWVEDPTATSIIWSYVSSSGYAGWTSNGPNVEVTINSNSPNGWIRLRCTTSNACGSYAWDFWFTPQGSTASCPVYLDPNCLLIEYLVEEPKPSQQKITLSPNPSNGQFKVSLSSTVKDAAIRSIRIRNKMGIEVYQQNFKNAKKEQTINLFTQPTDVYIVEIFDGEKWLSEKLSLQR